MSDIGGMRLNTPESRWRADRSSDLIIYLSAGGRLTRRSRREGTRGAFRRNGTVPPLLVTPMFVPGTRRIPDRTKSGAAPFSSSSGAVGGLMLPNWLRERGPPGRGLGDVGPPGRNTGTIQAGKETSGPNSGLVEGTPAAGFTVPARSTAEPKGAILQSANIRL